MLYSVGFYALSGEAFAGELRKPSAKLKDKLQRFLKKRLKSNKDAFDDITAAAESIFRGRIPKNAPQDFFDAFFAILNVTTENIPVSSFNDFNYSAFLDEVGIWPWFQLEKPPFPMPRTKEGLPEFGYMSAAFIREVVLPGIPKLPPEEVARVARNQFAEIAESVSDDGLDLVGYFTVW